MTEPSKERGKVRRYPGVVSQDAATSVCVVDDVLDESEPEAGQDDTLEGGQDDAQADRFAKLRGRGRELTQLRNDHREICRLYTTGMARKEIAKTLGVSITTVHKTLQSTPGKAEVARLEAKREEAQLAPKDGAHRLAKTGLDWYAAVLNGEEKVQPSIKLRVVQDVMDRAGLSRRPGAAKGGPGEGISDEELCKLVSELEQRFENVRDSDGVLDLSRALDSAAETVKVFMVQCTTHGAAQSSRTVEAGALAELTELLDGGVQVLEDVTDADDGLSGHDSVASVASDLGSVFHRLGERVMV